MDIFEITPQQEAQWIEEILQEASAHGLRQEVIECANKYMDEDPQMDKIVAYQLAHMEWIK
jgi:hypothetical protein